MKPTLLDNFLICFYFLLWVIVFILYHKKNRHLDAGSAIIGSYICYAFFSILTLNRPITIWDYYDFYHLKLFPFIYLFVMLVIALSPAINLHNKPIREIEKPNSLILYAVSLLVILSAIALFPNIIMNIGDGLVKLVTDTDAGKDAYEEQLSNAAESGGGISNISAIVFNAFVEIAVFLFFYFLTLKEKRIFVLLGLGFSIIVAVLQPVMAGQRSVVIYNILTIVLGFFFFKQYMGYFTRKIIRIIGVLVIALTMVPIMAITISRFSQYRQSSISDYVNWYIGQGNLYFNNYGLDDNGIRYGDRTFNLVKRLISSDASQNFVERRATYGNLYVNDDIFTTFVGDFTIDFGPVVALILFVLFNSWVIYETRVQDDKMKIHQALLLFFSMTICMQGGMTLFTFSDTANLKMLCFAMIYFYLVTYENVQAKFSKYYIIVRPAPLKKPKMRIVLKK